MVQVNIILDENTTTRISFSKNTVVKQMGKQSPSTTSHEDVLKLQLVVVFILVATYWLSYFLRLALLRVKRGWVERQRERVDHWGPRSEVVEDEDIYERILDWDIL